MRSFRHSLAALALGLCCACGEGETRNGRVLVVAETSEALGLDPAIVSDAESIDVCEQIFEHLVRYRVERGAMKLAPALATSWKQSTDGRTWTFKLRENVKFHDGTMMNADAVVFSFMRQKEATRTAEGRRRYFYWHANYRTIVEIKKVSKMQVAITTDRPFAPLLASLAMFPVSIVSPTAFKKGRRQFERHPVGTGPFKFVSWDKKSARITLKAFNDYWGGRPKLDGIVFVKIEDARQRLNALESGQVHIARNLPPELLQLVRLHPDLKTAEVPANNIFYLAMNTLKAPFNDPRVRWAVNHAIRKDPIIGLVYQDQAKPAIGPLPPGIGAYYTNKVKTYAYNPTLARRYLREAGYKPTRRVKFYAMRSGRVYISQPVKAARMMARDLRAIGMTVDLIVKPFGQMKGEVGLGHHDLAILGWTGDNGDPDNFLYNLLDADNAIQTRTTLNISFYKNYRFHRLVVAAREATAIADRVRLYHQAQRVVTESAPWVPIAHAKSVIALRREVRGFVVHPSSILYLSGLSLSRR